MLHHPPRVRQTTPRCPNREPQLLADIVNRRCGHPGKSQDRLRWPVSGAKPVWRPRAPHRLQALPLAENRVPDELLSVRRSFLSYHGVQRGTYVKAETHGGNSEQSSVDMNGNNTCDKWWLIADHVEYPIGALV